MENLNARLADAMKTAAETKIAFEGQRAAAAVDGRLRETAQEVGTKQMKNELTGLIRGISMRVFGVW